MRGQPHHQPWAKLTRDDHQQVAAWHPLAHHCADVAACAESLLRHTILGARLARLGGLPNLTERQIQRLCFLVALHDAGKCNQGFQRKALPKPYNTAGHVRELLGALVPGYELHKKLIQALGCASWNSWGVGETASQLFNASVSHHGQPVAFGTPSNPTHWDATPHADPVARVRDLREQAQAWFPGAFEGQGADLPSAAPFQHAFSGLVMLADWMGSDAKWFPYSGSVEDDRITWARAQARAMLHTLGLDAQAARADLSPRAPDFQQVFGYQPRPAQEALHALPATDELRLCVLESDTGSGKTEAALARFLTLFGAGLVEGLYFALPTRTAATQIYSRVTQAVARAFPNLEHRPPVVLAVPGYVSVDGTQGTKLPDFQVLWPDHSHARERGWAAEHPKRFLAAPIAVGTIDQLLLSTLCVHHAHLRATASLRHLLVIDEVHASDAYMTRLTEELLARHLHAGGHALLMSATLGADAHARLTATVPSSPRAPAPRKRAPLPSLQDAAQRPYPALTLAPHPQHIHLQALDTYEPPRALAWEPKPWLEDPQRIAQEALHAARQGARVLVLRNTVRGCLETQAALEALLLPHERALAFQAQGRLVPHHARYAQPDRKTLDEAVEDALGKLSEGQTPRPCVVVATQTVQQSLDLDADFLLTDLCPMDVLLQRVGRLHRHRARANRPHAYAHPQAWVLTPAARDLSALLRSDGSAGGGNGLGTVYEDLRILEATWRQLLLHPRPTLPALNRTLVEASTHPDALDALTREGGPPWELHARWVWGSTQGDRRTADLGLLPWRETPFGEWAFAQDLGRLATRLGAQDRAVSFEAPPISALGHPIHTLNLQAHLLTDEARAADELAPEQVEPLEGGGFSFRLGERLYLYDRLGLRYSP